MHYIRPANNLTERYGEKSWAIITGATDGIGKGFSIELAKLNFNLILVSRTQSKLDQVAEEIKKITDYKIEIKTIAFDFSLKTKPSDYIKAFSECKDLNISMLVNNVGWHSGMDKSIADENPVDLESCININIKPQAFLTTMFAEQLSQRSGYLSCIINLSSSKGTISVGKTTMYEAAKAFNDHFSKACYYELKKSLDVISLKPMYVETPMTNVKANWYHVLTVDQFVKHSLRLTGQEVSTFSHPKHDWQASIAHYIAPGRNIIGKKIKFISNYEY